MNLSGNHPQTRQYVLQDDVMSHEIQHLNIKAYNSIFHHMIILLPGMKCSGQITFHDGMVSHYYL